MRSTYLLVIATVLAGCATSSGVVPSEQQGIYLVSQEHRTKFSTLNTVQHAAISEATNFCEERGQDFELLAAEGQLSTKEKHPAALVRFQCVKKPQIVRFGEH